MAPHAGFDTDQIKDKARKDLLYLLEGVSEASPSPKLLEVAADMLILAGPWKEEPRAREEFGWSTWCNCQVFDSSRLRRR